MPKGKYVRRIDNLGRICVPISIRRKLGVMEGGRLEFFLEGDKLIARECTASCDCCDEPAEDLCAVGGMMLCSQCLEKMKGDIEKMSGR